MTPHYISDQKRMIETIYTWALIMGYKLKVEPDPIIENSYHLYVEYGDDWNYHGILAPESILVL